MCVGRRSGLRISPHATIATLVDRCSRAYLEWVAEPAAPPTAIGAARRILEADRAVAVTQSIARQRPDLATQARRRRATEVRAALEAARALPPNDSLRIALERVAAAHDAWQEAAPDTEDEGRLADAYTIALFALTRALRGPTRRPAG